MVDDVERLRDLAHRLWVAEGCPDVPRQELMRRASALLARQERSLKESSTEPEVVPFSAAASDS